MKLFDVIVLAWLFLLAGIQGCSSIPGESGEEQAESIDSLVERTLADLALQQPGTTDEIASSVGYIVMSNKITKIPIVGAGSGYGVGINTASGEKTYLKMARFDVGGGWGVRSVRPVLIFQDEKKYLDFIGGKWGATAGAEAAAKVGESGAAGGAGSGDVGDKGYSIYMITDAGVSVTATVGIIRVKPVSLKK
ncbi:MAG: hypothetical protein MUP90_03060 [Gammaproteobacteria bacterium]|nr:hypothetical protein [Gammaproteobacteria bacterium]